MWISTDITPVPIDIPVVLSMTDVCGNRREVRGIKLLDDDHILLFEGEDLSRFYCPKETNETITHWRKWRKDKDR